MLNNNEIFLEVKNSLYQINNRINNIENKLTHITNKIEYFELNKFKDYIPEYKILPKDKSNQGLSLYMKKHIMNDMCKVDNRDKNINSDSLFENNTNFIEKQVRQRNNSIDENPRVFKNKVNFAITPVFDNLNIENERYKINCADERFLDFISPYKPEFNPENSKDGKIRKYETNTFEYMFYNKFCKLINKLPPYALLYGFSSINIVLDIIYIIFTSIICIAHVSLILSDYKLIHMPSWIIILIWSSYLSTWSWMLVKSATQPKNAGWVARSIHDARIYYIKHYFQIDLLYAIPLELFLFNYPILFSYTLCLHWIRWFRLWFMFTNHNIYDKFNTRLKIFTYIAFSFVLFHLFIKLAVLILSKNAGYKTSITYLDGAYFIMSTITSTGYGDLIPTTMYGRLFAIIVMALGLLFVSFSTAWFIKFITKKDPLAEEINNHYQMMYTMLKDYSIPWEIMQEILIILPSIIRSTRENQFKLVLDKLPYTLNIQLHQYIQLQMIKKLDVLKNVNDGILMSLVEQLKPLSVPEGTVIFTEGDFANEIYFLMNGSVNLIKSYNNEKIVINKIHSRSIFGETDALYKTKRTSTIQAISICELMILVKEDLKEFIKNFI